MKRRTFLGAASTFVASVGIAGCSQAPGEGAETEALDEGDVREKVVRDAPYDEGMALPRMSPRSSQIKSI